MHGPLEGMMDQWYTSIRRRQEARMYEEEDCGKNEKKMTGGAPLLASNSTGSLRDDPLVLTTNALYDDTQSESDSESLSSSTPGSSVSSSGSMFLKGIPNFSLKPRGEASPHGSIVATITSHPLGKKASRVVSSPGVTQKVITPNPTYEPSASSRNIQAYFPDDTINFGGPNLPDQKDGSVLSDDSSDDIKDQPLLFITTNANPLYKGENDGQGTLADTGSPLEKLPSAGFYIREIDTDSPTGETDIYDTLNFGGPNLPDGAEVLVKNDDQRESASQYLSPSSSQSTLYLTPFTSLSTAPSTSLSSSHLVQAHLPEDDTLNLGSPHLLPSGADDVASMTTSDAVVSEELSMSDNLYNDQVDGYPSAGSILNGDVQVDDKASSNLIYTTHRNTAYESNPDEQLPSQAPSATAQSTPHPIVETGLHDEAGTLNFGGPSLPTGAKVIEENDDQRASGDSQDEANFFTNLPTVFESIRTGATHPPQEPYVAQPQEPSVTPFQAPSVTPLQAPLTGPFQEPSVTPPQTLSQALVNSVSETPSPEFQSPLESTSLSTSSSQALVGMDPDTQPITVSSVNNALGSEHRGSVTILQPVWASSPETVGETAQDSGSALLATGLGLGTLTLIALFFPRL